MRGAKVRLKFVDGRQLGHGIAKTKINKTGEPAPQGGGDSASVKPDSGGHRSTESKLGRREVIAIIGGLALAMFLGALNQTIVATALPTIGRAFDDFENLSWVVIAYLLTSTVVAPLYGKLSDIYGRRGMMLVALGIFMAGSAACAAAPSMLMLILGRGLQGIGGGGIVPLTQSIIADAVPPRERGYYQAYTGSVWIVAGAAGPVLGGVIAEHLHWSVIFWLNVPLGLAAAMLSNRQLKRVPVHERAHKIDLTGAALMMAAAVALLLALTWGGTRYSWLSQQIVASGHRRDRADRGIHLVGAARAGAVFAGRGAQQSGDARRLCDHRLHARRLHRPDDLRAALLRDGAWPFGQRFRPGADSHRDDDDAGLVSVRPRHAVHGPLQMGADRDAQHRRRGGRAAGRPSADAGMGGGADHRPGRHRHRQARIRPSPSRSRTRSRISRSASPWAR